MIICISNSIQAQSLAINTDGSAAATTALLDVKSINKGMLIPRMSKLQRQGIIAPATGLLVYQNAPDSTGFYFYDGSSWQQMATGSNLAQNWNLLGNAGTNATNFLGTTDAADLRFKANNQQVGYFGNSSKNIFLGENAGSLTTPGTRNIFIGSGAGSQNNNIDNLIAIGDSALVKNGVGAIFSQDGLYNLAIGSRALYANTVGYNNTALGGSALSVNNIGYYNTAIGFGTLGSNTGGNSNTALGVYALSSTSTGANNTSVGTLASLLNTTGNDNTAMGYLSLFFNNTGYSNVAVGSMALYHSINKSNLVAIGDSALFNNSSGAGAGLAIQNTAVGSKALYANTQGLSNTAMGYNASYSNTIGNWNTATGSAALYANNTGSSNTATGSGAMMANTSGHDNAALGSYALTTNSIGSWNTALGSWSMYYNSSGDQNIAIGSLSMYLNSSGSNNISLGSSSLYNNNGAFNIAIGSNALHANLSSGFNTAVGPFSLFANTGVNNTAVGNSALSTNVTGNYNTAIGDAADVTASNLSYATAIGRNAKVSTGNTLVLGGTSTAAVNVAIGSTTASSYGMPGTPRILEIKNDGNPALSGLTSNLVLSTNATIGSMGGVLWASPFLTPEYRMGYIEDIFDGLAARIAFSTRNNAGTFAERMTLSGAGNLGIGTATPTAPLQFSNSVVNRKIVLYDGTSNDNQYYGFGINGGVLRYQVDATAADHVFYAASSSTTSTELMRIRGSGVVGIGTATATKTLEVVGNAGSSPVTAVIANRNGFGPASLELVSDYGLASQWRPGYIKSNDLGSFTGSLEFYTNGTGGANLYGSVKALQIVNGVTYTATGTIASFSDARLKKDIEPFTDGLNVITQINPVSFQYTEDAPFPSKEKQVGIIAQDLEKQAPYMVHQTADKQIKDLRWVDNQAYVFLLINAVKEQQAQIDALKKDVKRLEEGKKR